MGSLFPFEPVQAHSGRFWDRRLEGFGVNCFRQAKKEKEGSGVLGASHKEPALSREQHFLNVAFSYRRFIFPVFSTEVNGDKLSTPFRIEH